MFQKCLTSDFKFLESRQMSWVATNTQKLSSPINNLELSGDHCYYGMTSNKRFWSFSKMAYFGLRIFGVKTKCRKSTNTSQKRSYPLKTLELFGDHFGYGMTSNHQFSCFSKMSTSTSNFWSQEDLIFGNGFKNCFACGWKWCYRYTFTENIMPPLWFDCELSTTASVNSF